MISFVIPTYKNKEKLFKNLDHNMKYFEKHEIIVVNDYPLEDLSEDFKNYKNIILIQNKKNLGFGPTVDTGVATAKNEYVVLLNSDVLLTDNSYKNLVSEFKKDETLFAIGFAQKEKDGSIVGKNAIFWKHGMFLHKKAHNLSEGITAWAEGGTSIVDREKFIKLGGFSALYSPFYWEDIDLSYRAWKAGYTILFNPKVEVEHHHESTIGKYFIKRYVKAVSYRNQFLFIWSNITDSSLLLSHLVLLVPNLIYYSMKGEWVMVQGFLQAITRLPQVLAKRAQQKTDKSDLEILQYFNEK